MTQQTNSRLWTTKHRRRKLLSSNLKASGYAVRVATDGSEALKLIEEHPFDLLLLDVNMPGPKRGVSRPLASVLANSGSRAYESPVVYLRLVG